MQNASETEMMLQETARKALRNTKVPRNRKEYAIKQPKMLHKTAKKSPRNRRDCFKKQQRRLRAELRMRQETAKNVP